MKKFNLFNEIITLSKSELLNAINSSKVFGIDIDGNIKHEPFSAKDILVYQGQPTIVENFSMVLGKNYQVVEDNDRILIKAFSNWQELININTSRASYDDTTADGVAEFSNKELEDIGWYSVEFGISYRELVEVLEEKCEGTILCIEQEEPYQFSGLGFIQDDEDAKKVLFSHCQKQIKHLIENNDEYEIGNLTDDEAHGASFFDVI